MQHCLTDCNEPQIDQATPGNPSTIPLHTPLLRLDATVRICMCVGQSLANFICNQPPSHSPLPAAPCPLLRCWQQLPLVVATPATPPALPLQRQGCILPGYCTNYELALLARGGERAWAGLRPEFPAGNSHEIHMKFID